MRLVSLSLSPMAPRILWNYTPVISTGGRCFWGVGVERISHQNIALFFFQEIDGSACKLYFYALQTLSILKLYYWQFSLLILKRISTHDPFCHKNWYYLFNGRLHSINYVLLQQMRGGLNQWLLPLLSKIPWCCLPLSPETQVVVFMRNGRIPLSRVETGLLSS